MDLKEKYRICDDISWRQVDDEIIILNLDSGDYFSLNKTGGYIFLAINNNQPLESLLKEQREEFNKPTEELRKDINDLLQELLENKIIEIFE
jgi:hypothetical protein